MKYRKLAYPVSSSRRTGETYLECKIKKVVGHSLENGRVWMYLMDSTRKLYQHAQTLGYSSYIFLNSF